MAGLLGTLYYLDIPSFLRRRLQSAPKVTPRCHDANTPPSLADFKVLTQQQTQKTTYPLAKTIQKNIPIYDCSTFDLSSSSGTSQIDALQNELYHNLTVGPGVYILKNFFTDLSVLDSTNTAYDTIIAREQSGTGGQKGDHFAPASANARIWNSFSKHCLQDPQSFVSYFSNPWFRIVCEAYLGPGYRLTSQVNIVRPGGKAQMPHRDFHLGFQTDADVVAWPRKIHDFSGLLTLQGAVAHTACPLESGPTRLLPWSQNFGEGFRAYRSKEFIEYFLSKYVALALEKGDAVFFSPALFHAAGENLTESFSRSVNLIQVSSAFGKAMETIDTLPLIEGTYGLLVEKYRVEGMSVEVEAFIRAVAEGYPFPTNLDCRPPAPGGMAPESEQDVLKRGLVEGWDREMTMRELTEMKEASSAGGKIARQTTVFGT